MYTVGDFLIKVKNAYRAHKKQVEYPYSRAVASIGKILEKEGYAAKTKEKTLEGKKIFTIDLKYDGKIAAISEIKLISKPSVHHYVTKSNIKKRVPRHATGILSTNKGIMTSREAQKQGVGGELICQIF